MRKVAAVLAVVTALLTAGPAHAAGCPMLTDPTGDTLSELNVPQSLVQPGPWDIVSADLATGATSLTAVIRLRDLGNANPVDNAAFLATSWQVSWALGGQRHLVRLVIGFGRVVAEYTYTDAAAPLAVPVTIDHGADSISWTVPRSAVPGLAPGATFSYLTAMSSFVSSSVDQAAGDGAFYTDGAPGCIPAA
jgi:hypothetical protein